MDKTEISVQVKEDFLSSTIDTYRVFHVRTDLLKYSPGGSQVAVVFVCQVEKDCLEIDAKAQAISFYEKVHQGLPVFHTKEMKASFKTKFQNITKITQSLLECLYQQLALDSYLTFSDL